MSDIKVRADELCGKHVGMYLAGKKIIGVNSHAGAASVFVERGVGPREFDPDDTVTLSDTPTLDLPTEDGALVAATYGSRRQVFLRWNNAWESKWDHIDDASWLSDAQELVAVPKEEYEALVRKLAGPYGLAQAAHNLVGATHALESSLS